MVCIARKNYTPICFLLKRNYSKFSYNKNNSFPNSFKPLPLINNTRKLSGRCAFASGIAIALGIGVGNGTVVVFYVLNKSNTEKKES
ncbi:MAG: hypothetical protein KDK96_09930 [Chlamydiia bacterium]|nr:hypothetical protein [Chlamydiia bacterium]